MTVEVTVRHARVSAEMQDYARKKAEELCRDFQKIENVHVVLDIERHLFRAEFVVQQKGVSNVGMVEAQDNLMTAIDGAVIKVAKQMRKRRDKQVRSRHGGESVADGGA